MKNKLVEFVCYTAVTNYDNIVSYVHIPLVPLNAGAKRSEATCHMAMPQCCYLAKRQNHTANMLTSSNNNLKTIAAMEFF